MEEKFTQNSRKNLEDSRRVKKTKLQSFGLKKHTQQ